MSTYEQKYIKYKNKYLKLKEQLGGENNINSQINEIDNYFDNIKYSSMTNDDREKFARGKYADTYGEFTGPGILVMVDKIKEILKIDNVSNLNFIDLGCGRGRVVFICSLLFNHSYGVEYSEQRCGVAMEYKNNHNFNNTTLICGDMFEFNDFNNIDVIYISSLCFSDEMIDKLQNILAVKARDNALIFTSKMFNHTLDTIKYLGSINVKMTWSDNSELHVYQIKRTPQVSF